MMKKLLLTISSLAVFAVAVSAQGTPESAILQAREQFSGIKNRSIELERAKRDANKRPASEDSTKRFPQIKEDFEQIQIATDSVIKLTDAKSPFNEADVLKFVSEINRRAVRLKSNLFPADVKTKKDAKNKPPVVDSSDLKKLLSSLDESVHSFAHSSIFQNINLVNSADSLKAQKDLQTVIEVTGAIKLKIKN